VDQKIKFISEDKFVLTYFVVWL